MTTLTTTTQPASVSALKQVIIRHPLVAYFGLAFAGTWGVQLPMLLSRDGLGLLPHTVPMLPFMLLFLLSTYAGPALAAFVITATESGRTGVRAFLCRFVRWRVGLRWWLLVLGGYPLLHVLAATVFMGTAPLQAVATKWPLFFTSYLPTLLLIQGTTQWAEEPGWRGFALPRLQARFGPVPGSLLLGLLHGLWHLPVFTYIGGPVPLGPFDLPTFALNTALIALMTIVWTWVYNNTGGSILLAVLLHSSFNASGPLIEKLIPAYPDAAGYLLQIAYVVISLLLIIVTKGRLGYRAHIGSSEPAVSAKGDTSSMSA
jgi:membrane protease YdiL (CAAX protease family)